MVIQLPGDILFESGKDELKGGGKDVLGQVADVVRNDKDLNARNFQVAGHTDNQKYPPGGPFHDNWGLSLSRARQVLLFLVTPAAEGGRARPDPLGRGWATARPTRWPGRWRRRPKTSRGRTAASSSSFSRTSRKC